MPEIARPTSSGFFTIGLRVAGRGRGVGSCWDRGRWAGAGVGAGTGGGGSELGFLLLQLLLAFVELVVHFSKWCRFPFGSGGSSVVDGECVDVGGGGVGDL